MPADQIGVVLIAADHSLSMPENLPEKRLADDVEIDEVNRPAGSGRQLGDQRHFLAGVKTVPGVDCHIQITCRSPRARRKRTEQNQQLDTRLHADAAQDRLLELQVLQVHNLYLSSGTW